MNCFMNPSIVRSLMGIMNDWFSHHSKPLIMKIEFEGFVRLIHWLCFYQTSITQVFDEPTCFVDVIKLIDYAISGKNRDDRRARVVDLFRSLDGSPKRHVSMTWDAVYGKDPATEQFLQECGRVSSNLCYVCGQTKPA